MLKLLSLNIIIFIILSCVTINYSYLYNYNTNYNFFINYFFIDFFSFIMLVTTIITLILCLFIVDNKYFYKNKELFLIFNLFFVFVFGLIYSNNIFSFFIFYELLLIPAYMLVLKSSPNRRSKIVANYFLLWTQLGSFLVLLGIFINYSFFINFNFYNYINNFIIFLFQILIFFGFGIKIPLWPFHFWLSKTHVEANTGFSIFLSGILVKAAIWGLYKFIYLFITANSWFFLLFCFISLIDASLKMCIQNDLKKLVAFSTIQEMAFMTLLLLLPSTKNNQILFIFVIFHTFISGLFFWIVECIYKRYNTRVVYNIHNISNLSPTLSKFIIISVYLFMGLPFTIKFSIEIFIFKNLINYNFFIFLIIGFFINYLCMVFFFKTYIFINFGNQIKVNFLDLTKKEVIIFIYFITSIILLNFL